MNKMIMSLLTGVVMLTGCAGAQAEFECTATSSDSCMTIDAANNMARQEAKISAVKPGVALLPIQVRSTSIGVSLNGLPRGISLRRPPVRIPEATAKVWIAPWIDGQDNLHEPGLLLFVVKSGEWHQ